MKALKNWVSALIILKTLILSVFIFSALGAIVLAGIRFKAKKFKILSWFFSLSTVYLLFGIVQQIFFQAVFTDTLRYLVDDVSLVIIFSSVFYSSFHWNWDAKGIRFGLITLMSGVVWSVLYLKSPNIFLLGLSHGILASLYYFIVYEDNILRKKLSFKF